jgi:hypothetical protein
VIAKLSLSNMASKKPPRVILHFPSRSIVMCSIPMKGGYF